MSGTFSLTYIFKWISAKNVMVPLLRFLKKKMPSTKTFVFQNTKKEGGSEPPEKQHVRGTSSESGRSGRGRSFSCLMSGKRFSLGPFFSLKLKWQVFQQKQNPLLLKPDVVTKMLQMSIENDLLGICNLTFYC